MNFETWVTLTHAQWYDKIQLNQGSIYWEGGRKLSLQTSKKSFRPPQKKVFLKKFKAISNKGLFDDDFKESAKVINVQCDFSQSWTLYFQNFPGEHVPGP